MPKQKLKLNQSQKRSRSTSARKAQAQVFPRGKILASSFMVLAVASLVSTLFAEVRTVGDTVAYFNDQEASVENKLQATSLFVSLSAMDDYAADYAQGHFGDEEYYLGVQLGGGSSPANYVVSGWLDPANPPGCEFMNITATFGDYTYSGPFGNFISTPITNMGEWDFELSLPPGVTSDYAMCNGKIIFKASLASVDENLTNTYTDEKAYTFEIIAEPTLDEPVPEVQGLTIEEPAPYVHEEPPAGDAPQGDVEAPPGEPSAPEVPEVVDPPVDEAPTEPPAEVEEPVTQEPAPVEEPPAEPEPTPEPVVEPPPPSEPAPSV